jgi:hypothetical protein
LDRQAGLRTCQRNVGDDIIANGSSSVGDAVSVPIVLKGSKLLPLQPDAAKAAHRLVSTFMPLDLPETTSKTGSPLVRQFSVFLPNKVGAMLDIVKLLNSHQTHIVALSVSESTDSAIARIVVSDPDEVEELLRDKNIAFGKCEVVVVELREVATQLVKLLSTLFMGEINVHFTYPLLIRPR